MREGQVYRRELMKQEIEDKIEDQRGETINNVESYLMKYIEFFL